MNDTNQTTPPYDKAEDERIEKANAEQRSVAACCVSIPVVIILLIGGLVKYVLGPCSTFPIIDEVVQSVPSPDKAYIAAIISPATSEADPHRVVLCKSMDALEPDNEGKINVASVYIDHEAYPIDIHWKNNRTLIIETEVCSVGKVSKYKLAAIWEDVNVMSQECKWRQQTAK